MDFLIFICLRELDGHGEQFALCSPSPPYVFIGASPTLLHLFVPHSDSHEEGGGAKAGSDLYMEDLIPGYTAQRAELLQPGGQFLVLDDRENSTNTFRVRPPTRRGDDNIDSESNLRLYVQHINDLHLGELAVDKLLFSGVTQIYSDVFESENASYNNVSLQRSPSAQTHHRRGDSTATGSFASQSPQEPNETDTLSDDSLFLTNSRQRLASLAVSGADDELDEISLH